MQSLLLSSHLVLFIWLYLYDLKAGDCTEKFSKNAIAYWKQISPVFAQIVAQSKLYVEYVFRYIFVSPFLLICSLSLSKQQLSLSVLKVPSH